MTREMLKNYTKLKSETRMIECEISLLTKHGAQQPLASEEKVSELMDKKGRLEALIRDVEGFIDGLGDADSEIRQIITLRYLKGMTWRKVVREIYNGCADETMPLQKVKRYLAKQGASGVRP